MLLPIVCSAEQLQRDGQSMLELIQQGILPFYPLCCSLLVLELVNNLLQSARSSRIADQSNHRTQISSAQDHKHFKKKKLLASHAAMLSQEEEAPFVYVDRPSLAGCKVAGNALHDQPWAWPGRALQSRVSCGQLQTVIKPVLFLFCA